MIVMNFRPEHPNPQFERESWINLNGEWLFTFDFGKSGLERKMYLCDEDILKYYDKKINVPFCPESKLSGIEYKDFMNAVWYRRSVVLNGEQLSGRTIIHFGAVDYECHVFINGREVGKHIGGYSSFAYDITEYVQEGENIVVVYVIDEVRSGRQAAGKQCGSYYSGGCMYTRTTGIWQTVWLEFVPENYVKEVKFYPDIQKQCFYIECQVVGQGNVSFTALYEGRGCGVVTGKAVGDDNRFVLPVNELHLWECGKGRLYDIIIDYNSGELCDKIKSYVGMRQVRLEGYKFLLNEKPVFLRTVLDQGFYKDGIYTAPSDEALLQDIQRSMALGFNGARLHEKIFEPRFLYHCDREGYLVWGEHANWGLDLSNPAAFLNFMPEWLEAVKRDFNHPAIIGWCPFNETWDYDGRRQINLILENIYKMTKTLDPTRPCIDTSGNFHVVTDIYDVHNYYQDPGDFASHYKDFPEDTESLESYPDRQHYRTGQPLFVSEYGGIKWDVEHTEEAAWGYGEAPRTEEEFMERYRGLTECLLKNPCIMGFCYTQLYDVEQEVNGLYTYDRKAKFDPEIIRKINAQTAAIEME
ncbi:MAG: beta-galactosidase [Lachnospiraceae bacterium]|nr:beta-galactosidase [Lachnospiraceae bacterium]